MAKDAKSDRTATSRSGDTNQNRQGGRAQTLKRVREHLQDDVVEELGQEAPPRDRAHGRTGGSHQQGPRGGVESTPELHGGEADLFSELKARTPRAGARRPRRI